MYTVIQSQDKLLDLKKSFLLSPVAQRDSLVSHF